MTASSPVWLITGCSSGLGRALATRALSHGHRVIATARRPGLDVVVNNAGYGLAGAFEEPGVGPTPRNFETKFFGALEVIRAALPILRAQQSGHIVSISAAAVIANYAGFSIYGATKWALKGVSESLAAELKSLGIEVTIVQPGPFRTDFIECSLDRAESHIADYDRTSGKFLRFLETMDGKQPGDPDKAADGLGDPAADLSAHLRSRHQTGDALRESGVPVTEFRAGVIVGSGSLSFEMIRYLTEQVPVMICPLWVYTRIQPIAVRNVLDYLVEALRVPASAGEVVEIGGADVISYGEMLTFYAEVRGLRRWLVPVPVLTPKLSSYWVHFVTPIPASIARPLIAGLRNEIIVRDDRARRLFPTIQPLDYRTAVKLALEKLDARSVESAWSDALSASHRGAPPIALTTHEGMIVERRQMPVNAPVEAIFRAFTGVGGTRGWLYLNWTSRLRGACDRLCGGVGMRRGRRDADEIRVGEALDFWRVEAIDPGRMMRLRAEMKVPGKAWLQFETRAEDGDSRPLLIQTAFFAPKGLFGFAYWYLLYPIHALIFGGLIRRLAERARTITTPRPSHA